MGIMRRVGLVAPSGSGCAEWVWLRQVGLVAGRADGQVGLAGWWRARGGHVTRGRRVTRGGRVYPVLPLTTTSGMPYLSVATQGFSMASASSSTLGNPSLPVDGSAITWHRSNT